MPMAMPTGFIFCVCSLLNKPTVPEDMYECRNHEIMRSGRGRQAARATCPSSAQARTRVKHTTAPSTCASSAAPRGE